MNLNNKIEIQRRGSSQDTAGQVKKTWRNTGSVWASIRPISGREFANASGERAEITHEILLRHGHAVAPRDRVKYQSRFFDIKSVINIGERSRYLKLMAIEHAD